MSIKLLRRAKIAGFTLVELLITVAIIGILASQGVPAYRRMIQKSRKGEAQVMLSTIGTAESAFQAEYGSFGDNLARMGAQMDGTTFVYAAGPNVVAACTAIASGAFIPAALSIPQFPTYQTGVAGTRNGFIGRATQATCTATAAAPAVAVYNATATGSINIISDTCGGAATSCDVWTTDQTRAITNAQDGVQ